MTQRRRSYVELTWSNPCQNEQNDLIRDLRKDYNEAKFKFDKAIDEQNESKAEFNQKVNEITKVFEISFKSIVLES